MIVNTPQPFFPILKKGNYLKYIKVLFRRMSKEKVVIEMHDTFSLDYSLSKIIVPALERFMEVNAGYPLVDDCDVPKGLQNGEDYCDKKWNYILQRMYIAHLLVTLDDDFIYEENRTMEEYGALSDATDEIMKEGLYLFGKYYRALWT